MDVLKLCFVLLLPQVVFVKTNKHETDVTPLCSVQSIDQIACQIKTKTGHCYLTFQDGHNFLNGCSSKFELVALNQSVFLQWRNLSTDDTVELHCECVRRNKTLTYHFNIAGKDYEELNNFTKSKSPLALVIVAVAISLIILGFICKKICRKCCLRSSNSFDENDPNEVYTCLYQPDHNVYHTILSTHRWDETERNSIAKTLKSNWNSDKIYENL